MTEIACGLFENCLAPLCPLDTSSLKGIWYSDEEICRSRTHGNLTWISAQRKIARVKAGGYFTMEMLADIRTARRGLTGLDPNEEEEAQLRRWLDLHARKRTGREGGGRDGMKGKAQPAGEIQAGKADQPDLFGHGAAGPESGVSVPLKNVAKQGGQGKNLCRNRGSQPPNRRGTGKPPYAGSTRRKTMTKG
jgi:hypothetical protein